MPAPTTVLERKVAAALRRAAFPHAGFSDTEPADAAHHRAVFPPAGFSDTEPAAAALRRAAFPPNQTTLIVAASGGPDSTALLRSLHRLAPQFGLRLHVAHLNHDFRGAEADHDAAFVQRLADGLGLPASIDQQDPIAYQRQRNLSSFEQAAREMRYAFLAAVAQTVNAAAIALGHTADDQAETVLLHLLRGAGLHGLRGMAELSPWPWPQPQPGPALFRPLLSLTKSDTEAYCRALRQPCRHDSGNYMWRFTRNRIRHDLLPRLARDYNPQVRPALTRLSRAAAAAADYLESELTRHWPAIANETAGQITLRIDALTALHPALQRQALRRAANIVAGDARRLRESHLESMLDLLQQPRGGRVIHLPRGIIAKRQANALLLIRPADAPEPDRPQLDGEHPLPLPRTPGETVTTTANGWRITIRALPLQSPMPPQTAGYTARLNPAALDGAPPILRTRRPGDRFQPLGMTGAKKLQDFLTDAKIPRDQRDHIPLLVSQRGIAWIAGHRIAQWAAALNDAPSLEITLTPADTPPDNENPVAL